MLATFKFDKVVENIFKQSVRTFELKDLIKHRKIKQKSLLEILSRFPGGGIGFKVYRKTWPPGMFYQISHVNYKSPRYGNVFGSLYLKNKKAEFPKRIRGANKRGVWLYEFIGNEDIVLDNGLVYSSEEIKVMVDKYLSPRNNKTEEPGEAAEAVESSESPQSSEAAEGQTSQK